VLARERIDHHYCEQDSQFYPIIFNWLSRIFLADYRQPVSGEYDMNQLRFSRTGEGENVSRALQRLVILHTNDIHSHFDSMPKIARLIQHHRNMLTQDELLVIDCGDHLDRAYIETEGSDGAANIAVMNESGYDVAVPGNNEGLTFSIDSLERLYGEQARFPVIGSNMRLKDSGVIPTWLKPYMILHKAKLKIGIIGVTVDFTDFYSLLGWDICDPLETVSQLVTKLRQEVDIVVVISHLGLPADERMAHHIPGIDLIFGAHTHHLLEEPLRIGQTTICAAGKFGDYVGKLELVYDHAVQQIISVEGSCMETREHADLPEIETLIRRFRSTSEDHLRQVVTKIEDRLDIDWREESRLGNLLALGLREWCDAEIGLVNSGQLLDSLEAGDVSRGRLLEICPSPINPCRMILSGREIREALELSLLPIYQDKPIRGYGFRGEVLGMLSVSGLRIEVNHSKPDMHKIEHIFIHGKELEAEQDVTIGTIDMFTFGIGYDVLSRGRDIRYYVPEFLRDVLLYQLGHPERIVASAQKHWIHTGKSV